MREWTERESVIFKRDVKIFDVVVISLIVAASIYCLINYKEIMSYAFEDITYDGLWALFIFTFLFEFLPQAISPDYLLLLAMVAGINIYSAVLITIIASSIGSGLAFIIGYHYGFRVVAPFFNKKKLDKMLKVWNKHGKWFVLVSATIPLPVPYIPVIFGALRMKKIDFILWGIIPRAIGFIVTGIVGYLWFSGIIGL